MSERRTKDGIILPVPVIVPVRPADSTDLTFADLRILLPRPSDIKAMVDNTLARPCPDCGAAVEKHREPGQDLDIVCTKRCGYRFPIDTGPFSLVRRVD